RGTALVLAAARIPRRIGFRESRGAFFYHVRVTRDRRRHDVERNLALLDAFGPGPADAPRLHLAVDREAAARAAALLPAGPAPLVGLAPGSAWATKRWTPAGFAAVAAALEADGARCVLLGSAADRPLVEAIRAASGRRAVGLAGRTDVATLVAVIDRLALLIANDSAPVVRGADGRARLGRAPGGVAWAGERVVIGPAGRIDAATLPPAVRRLESALDLADATDARWLLLLGEDEVAAPELAAAVVDATTSGAAAYRIGRALELRGVTLRLP